MPTADDSDYRHAGTKPIQGNLASLDLNLPDEHLKRLNDASAIEPIFPNSFFANEFVRNLAYGGMRDSIDA